jgi:hypothetical protein
MVGYEKSGLFLCCAACSACCKYCKYVKTRFTVSMLRLVRGTIVQGADIQETILLHVEQMRRGTTRRIEQANFDQTNCGFCVRKLAYIHTFS